MTNRAQNEAMQQELYGTKLAFPGGNVSSAVTPDCRNGENQAFTMTGATQLNAPVNPPAIGTEQYFVFIQDATGGRALTFGSGIRNAPSIGGGSATGGQRASLYMRYDGANWQVLGGSSAFA